jgi:hypothetical protein
MESNIEACMSTKKRSRTQVAMRLPAAVPELDREGNTVAPHRSLVT